MKRAAGLAVIILICIVGCLSVQGNMPFAPAFGSAMEPAVASGSLLFAGSVKPDDIKTGDIVIVKVPPSARLDYGYPAVSVFRVMEIVPDWLGLSFRFQADNAPGESFLVGQRSIKGTVAGRVPVLGYPLVVFRGAGSVALVLVFILLLALYLYSREIGAFLNRRFHALISPVIEENRRSDDILTGRIGAAEKALESFSGAMQEYAVHLASHTSAIKGLSEASQDLKNSAAEQNRILGHVTASLIRQKNQREVARIKTVVNEFTQRTQEILQAKEALEKGTPGQAVVRRLNQRTSEILLAKQALEKALASELARRAAPEAPEISQPEPAPVKVTTPPADEKLEITVLKVKPPAPQGCAARPRAIQARHHIFLAYPKPAD